jgi:hypothetical protein
MLMILSFSAFAQRKALVIGNSRYYKDEISTSLNDAQLAADALKAIDYEVSQYSDLDYAATISALDNFKKSLVSGDTAVFYYAGFTKQIADKNYILPYSKSKLDDLDETLISVDVVLEALSRASNSFLFMENRTLPSGFPKSLCPKDKGLQSIQRLNANQGFAMASDVGKELRAQGERYSIFTYSLFNKITSDMYDFPVLMKSVQDEVYSYTSKDQKPYWQSNMKAPFTFWEPTQQLKFRFRLPSYRGLDGGGSYNF